ncbi:hypothetical protein VTO42DRAFT_6189 [Malbranchea cinnamomea]
MASKPPPSYTLRVAAGPSYDPLTHQEVVVNSEQPLLIENEHGTVRLNVRIQDYTGLPAISPRTSPYFSHPDHLSDQYSIAFSFVPKHDIPGTDLVFGNDFDHSVRDRLPPGCNYALKLVKWMIDPGIDGDLYADRPYLYGAALSSWNYFRICGRRRGISGSTTTERPAAPTATTSSATATATTTSRTNNSERDSSRGTGSDTAATAADSEPSAVPVPDEVIEEGAEDSGDEVRSRLEIPGLPEQRKKFFLDETKRQAFRFEAGRLYKVDFGNPYLGFSDFTLRLPGYRLQVAKYIDRKNHSLRYVLKNLRTGNVYFVVLFILELGDEGDEEGDDESGDEEEEDREEDMTVPPGESEVD